MPTAYRADGSGGRKDDKPAGERAIKQVQVVGAAARENPISEKDRRPRGDNKDSFRTELQTRAHACHSIRLKVTSFNQSPNQSLPVRPIRENPRSIRRLRSRRISLANLGALGG